MKALLILTTAICCFGQAVLDPAKLLQPPADSWPTYNGDYSGRRYSTLSQINQSNVGQLTIGWIAQLRTGAIKSAGLRPRVPGGSHGAFC